MRLERRIPPIIRCVRCDLVNAAIEDLSRDFAKPYARHSRPSNAGAAVAGGCSRSFRPA